jgi:glycosyltransferase involved in cell wall biosynthesis
MRIAIIGTTALSLLGFRKDLIKALVNEGTEVYALAVDYCDETKRAVLALGAKPVDYSISRGGLNPISAIRHTFKLSKTLKSISPDVVFSYFVKPVVFGTFAAKLAGVKRRIGMIEGLGYVFTDQPIGFSYKLRVLRQVQVFLYRLTFPLLDHLIFLNHDDPKDLIERYRIKIDAVSVLGGIGLNLDEYPFSVPVLEPIRFLFIGRLLAEKGIHYFVGAAKLVKKSHPDTEFIVLGGVDESNPGGLSQDDLSVYKEQSLIIHPGHVDNVADWIRDSSVFVLPSFYREGIPRSTQEAMAVGRAVITTNMPGCRETVEDGVNGFYVPPFSETALAEKMIFFIENKALITTMGLASRNLAVEKYDAKLVNRQLIDILRGEEK